MQLAHMKKLKAQPMNYMKNGIQNVVWQFEMVVGKNLNE